MTKTWKILIVDDDVSILRSYQKYLESEGFSVFTAKDGAEGFNKTIKESPEIILMDINMPVRTGLELLEDLNRELGTSMPLVIMLTAYGDLEAAVKATRLGAYDFLTKPVPLEKLRLSISRGIEKITLTEHVAHVIKDDSEFKDTIIGRDSSMIEIYKTIGTLQGNKASVLVCGESGTGKEMVAKAIHEMSSPGTPFIAINCAAIPENLIESELMGYVKGAFTGAAANREGKFEAVKTGTLLLDEISETPPDFQTKLLRFLQERQYYPVGGNEKKNFNGRVIAATNKNLKNLVDAGKFREDLYYRLNVITITVPPLRDHMSDFEMLVIHFMKKANLVLKTSLESITKEAVDYLKKYNWPGNLRELENVMIKASLNAKDRILTRDSFMFLASDPDKNGDLTETTSPAYDLFNKMVPLRDIEKEYIEFVLRQTNWHKGKSAEILGITRPTLDKRIEEFRLVKND